MPRANVIQRIQRVIDILAAFEFGEPLRDGDRFDEPLPFAEACEEDEKKDRGERWKKLRMKKLLKNLKS